MNNVRRGSEVLDVRNPCKGFPHKSVNVTLRLILFFVCVSGWEGLSELRRMGAHEW